MLPLERRQQILKQIYQDGNVTIDKVSRNLNVSGMTVRRDLDQLEEEGKVIRTHGGAVLAKSLIPETPYSNKVSQRSRQKRAIAELAVNMVPKGAKILLDSGTTTLELARTIAWREDLTIVTNDIKISVELIDSKSQIITTGGNMQRGIGALLGPQAQHLLEQIRVDLLFLGAHAIDLQSGVTAPSMDKALIKKFMINAAAKTWIVADSSKFNRRSFAQVCSLSRVDGIITDSECDKNNRMAFEQHVDMKFA